MTRGPLSGPQLATPGLPLSLLEWHGFYWIALVNIIFRHSKDGFDPLSRYCWTVNAWPFQKPWRRFALTPQDWCPPHGKIQHANFPWENHPFGKGGLSASMVIFGSPMLSSSNEVPLQWNSPISRSLVKHFYEDFIGCWLAPLVEAPRQRKWGQKMLGDSKIQPLLRWHGAGPGESMGLGIGQNRWLKNGKEWEMWV